LAQVQVLFDLRTNASLEGAAMAMSRLLLLAGSIACAGAMELTPDTWAEATAGKTVFIKFQAPW